MDDLPGALAFVVFSPRLVRLILQEGSYAWSRRQGLFTDPKKLRRRCIVRCQRATGKRTSQYDRDAGPDQPFSPQFVSALNRSTSPTARKCETDHRVFTASDPIPYQPSSCR